MLAELLDFRPADLLAYLAGALTVAVMIPQLVRTYRLKRARDVSLLTMLILVSVNFLWGTYGFCISNLPMIVTNALAFLVAIAAITLVMKYRNN